ncbi:MAG: 3-dehydroquinate synthase [Pelotomaculum sp. PtaU1.Bin035]|nr:MAG: 3-dehydroquinate synthase [Pelotomaculum sp. PtaU1.Bin035]
MEIIKVNLGARSYPIYTGAGILQNLGGYMRDLPVGKNVLVITNPTVRHLYCRIVEESLAEAGYCVTVGEIGDGEEFKTLNTAKSLYDLAFDSGIDRSSPVIALGGGVVGDTAGFVAATYLRGVPFIQVPTTLLAQVDSSVGGKVAVNHPRGKNIIGVFYQPRLVLADVSLLKTLPPRELRSGLAEVIKYGVIWSEEFFTWLEGKTGLLLACETDALTRVVRESCRIKANVVEEDETEGGLRAILNYGHTFGHAVEALTGYKKYTHGEAVGIGLVVAARLAESLGFLAAADCTRIESLVSRAGLPREIPENLTPKDIVGCFYHDKKTVGGRLTFILPGRIGKVDIIRDLEEHLILDLLRKTRGQLEEDKGMGQF